MNREFKSQWAITGLVCLKSVSKQPYVNKGMYNVKKKKKMQNFIII